MPNGFGLLEIMIILTIVGILAAIIIPNFVMKKEPKPPLPIYEITIDMNDVVKVVMCNEFYIYNRVWRLYRDEENQPFIIVDLNVNGTITAKRLN